MDYKQYLFEAEETFSGFDGFENIEATDLGFDGNDVESFSGANAVPTQMQANLPPSPYELLIENTLGAAGTAVIFGNNMNLLLPNFGSDAGIVITPTQANVSYLQLLQQSAFQPFETSLIRISANTLTQVLTPLTITSVDSNGQLCSVPLLTQSYFSANQFQSLIVDIPYNLKVDGNTFIQYNLLAAGQTPTSVLITFFPKLKVNPARNLSGLNQNKQYGAPMVNTVPALSLPRMIQGTR